MRRLLSLARRIFFILLVAIFFAWFGIRYGPPPRPVHAEIFRELSQPFFLNQRGLQSGGPSSGWRLSRVNNQPIYFKVEKAQGTVPGLFDYLERSVPVGEINLLTPASVVPPADAEEKEDSKKPVPIFRRQWATWGVLGFATKNDLVAVVAVQDEDAAATFYLTFRFDPSVDLQKVLPISNGDAPGRDVPSIPRYPGLKRTYTIEESGLNFESVITVYDGRGNGYAIANFYRERMAALGWNYTQLPRSPELQRSNQALYFARDGMDCLIATGPGREPGLVQLTVSVRQSTGEG